MCVCVRACVRACVCGNYNGTTLYYTIECMCVVCVLCMCVCVTNTHPITHIYHYSRQITLWCSVQYTDSQVGSDGDLGEGEEEEGGGAGLGMGYVLGGVVTFDVTVGGATCEFVCERESCKVTIDQQEPQETKEYL